MARCVELAGCTEEPGRITRPYGTPALVAARDALAGWMRQAGMDIRTDAIGNLRGRYAGTRAGAPALLLGSHFDSVRDAGKYDGPLGILIAIAAVERLAERGERLPFPIDIVAFPDEEGLRFQTTYLGSTALAGTFDLALLDRPDQEGITLREAVTTFGGDPEQLSTAALQPGDAFAYVEIHIEQGPFLESVEAPLGVVTAISGQTRLLATFTGEAGHAGTVAMHLRRDPLPAAAELALTAESLARATPGLLATVGAFQVGPGVSNVIPGSVQLSLDVRHPEDAQRQHAVQHLEQHASAIAAARNLGVEWELVRDHPAVQCDPDLVAGLSQAVVDSGQPLHLLPSGAGHDAVMIASRLPIGMLFVRCAGGISHNPAEAVSAGDVAAAIAAVERFMASLANDDSSSANRSHSSAAPAFDLIVRAGEVVLNDQIATADIAIRDGQIVEIAPSIAGSARDEIDASVLHVLPGIVDMHVHFNDPGRDDWEGWASGSLAASVGGTTTVVDMPLNAHPPTLDGASFDAKAAAAAASRVDFALWGGLTPLNLDRMEELAARGVVGFKAFMSNSGIDDFPRADDVTLCEGMQRAAALDLPVAVHAEDEELTARLTAEAKREGGATFAVYAASRPPEAELEAIARALDMARETGCALHVVHVSTATGLNAIGQARAQGLDVTSETCPHYLALSTKDADQLGALAKCAPPLRDEPERLALLHAVTSGQVQIIASDHSPCPPAMKQGDDYFAIWGGIAGCQSLFHATLGALSEIALPDLPALMQLLATNPAQRLKLAGKGRIAPGFDADLTLVNLAQRFTLEPADLRDRHRANPFVGQSFPGPVQQALLRGQSIVRDGAPLGSARGRLIRPAD